MEDVVVLCRDNQPVSKLRDYCKIHDIIYLPNSKTLGFSENNNLNFRYYQNNLSPLKGDYFLVLNPDIVMTNSTIERLKERLENDNGMAIYSANLFLDAEYIAQDDNIRRYPKFSDFVKTFLFANRKTMIDRNKSLPKDNNYWCSGSFMVVSPKLYKLLNGFNERYYLYCEDIDFCYRAKQKNIKIKYLDDVKAIHFRQRDSKRFFTKYFFWHVQSVFVYQLCKLFPVFFKSSVSEN